MSAGDDHQCTPPTVRVCYAGPQTTIDVGLCIAGEQTCDASGTAWSECVGEVLPTDEQCGGADDEDCDGFVNEEGSNCVCAPDEVSSCYAGPEATLDVGVCSAGEQTCEPSGLGFGNCVGEVLPSPEDCDTPADENCDGTVNETSSGCACPGENVQSLVSENCLTDFGEPLWRIPLPATPSQLEGGPSGELTMVMGPQGGVPMGYEPAASPTAFLLAQFDSTGALRWGKAGNASGNGWPSTQQGAFRVDAASDGSIALTTPVFSLATTYQLGSFALGPVPANHIRALYSVAADGTVQYAATIPRYSQNEINTLVNHAVAAGDDGSTYFAIAAYGLRLARYESLGVVAWQLDRMNATDHVQLDGTPDGGVVLAAVLAGALDLGGGPIANSGSPSADLTVARFAPDGSLVWAVRPRDGVGVISMQLDDGVIAIIDQHSLIRLSLADGSVLSDEAIPGYFYANSFAQVGSEGVLHGRQYTAIQNFGLGPLPFYGGATSGFAYALRSPGSTRFARAPLSQPLMFGAAPTRHLYGVWAHQTATIDMTGTPESLASGNYLYALGY